MKRRIGAGAAVGLFAAAASAAAASTPLAFELSKRIAEACVYCRDEQVTASGRVDPGRGRVRVQTSECQYPGWYDATSADPGADGRWSAAFYPPRSNARVRIVWNGRASATTELKVRSSVSLRYVVSPRRREWYVAVLGGNVTRRPVVLERFVSGGWRAFRTLRLGRYEGGYTEVRFRLRLPPGQPIRARYDPRHRCWEPGVSPVVVTKR